MASVGSDSGGYVYWLFDDCRLYREAPWLRDAAENVDENGIQLPMPVSQPLKAQATSPSGLSLKLIIKPRVETEYWKLV